MRWEGAIDHGDNFGQAMIQADKEQRRQGTSSKHASFMQGSLQTSLIASRCFYEPVDESCFRLDPALIDVMASRSKGMQHSQLTASKHNDLGMSFTASRSFFVWLKIMYCHGAIV
jgi:hypothetical protein